MVFVTGGTGLLGSHLIFSLLTSGEKVRAIYRDASKIQHVSRLFEFYSSSHLFNEIEWVSCDVLDVVTLEIAMTGCNEVYHCAAKVSFLSKDFQSMLKINREGTANVVNCALALSVERFCYVSSTAAVGKTSDSSGSYFVIETNKWIATDPHSGYAISKYVAENEVWRGVEEGLNAVIINPSVILGPASWNESSMTIFRTLSKGLKFYTAGSNAFVDVRDVVKAMRTLMNTPTSFQQRYLCTGTNISFLNLFQLIAKEMKIKPPYLFAGTILSGLAWRVSSIIGWFTGKVSITKDSAKSAQSNVVYDSSKLISTLNFHFNSLEDTIQHAVEGRLDSKKFKD